MIRNSKDNNAIVGAINWVAASGFLAATGMCLATFTLVQNSVIANPQTVNRSTNAAGNQIRSHDRDNGVACDGVETCAGGVCVAGEGAEDSNENGIPDARELSCLGECTPTDDVCVTVENATDAEANALGLSIFDVYVTLNTPGDKLLSIGFSNLTTNDPAGFFQHGSGGDTAPAQDDIDVTPELAYDSYVDIGLMAADPSDLTGLDPDWASPLFNSSGATAGGWFNSDPFSAQGVPDVDDRVFIARLAVGAGFTVSGELTIYNSVGNLDSGADGVVDATDLAFLLKSWGPCPFALVDPCVADLDGSGEVGASDLAHLIAAWGPCRPQR